MLYPLSLDCSTAGNKVTIPDGVCGLRLETLPPGAVLGLYVKGVREPVRLLLPGASYHFERDDIVPLFVAVLTAVGGVAYLTGWCKGVILLGGSTTTRRPGSPLSIVTDDASIAPYAGGLADRSGDVVIACPSDRAYEVLGGGAHFVTSAVVGNRIPTMIVTDRVGRVLANPQQGAGLAASSSGDFFLYANPGFPTLSAGVWVPPGGSLIIRLGTLAGNGFSQAGDQISRVSFFAYEHIN